MSANIKPLATGIHHLQVEVQGNFNLKINNEVVIAYQEGISDSAVLNYDVNLKEGEEYAFEIQYDGQEYFTLGWNAPGELFASEADYLTAAKKADAVIYFGGLSHADDRESIDRADMKLPNSQDEIITKLLKVNPKTIVFLVAGSAVEMPWVEKANAIVWGWYGGMEAGHAFADILTGKVNPSGKMPITLPARLEDTAPIVLNDYNAQESLYKEGVFIGYRWFEQQKIKPLFSFGHGLSFTQFDISNIKLSKNTVANNDNIVVTATVKNTGLIAGAEVVQLYLRDIKSSVLRPTKELKGFTKVMLQPQETQTVSFKLTMRDLSFWDENTQDWLAEAGEFEVLLGNSLDNISQQAKFTLQQ